MDAKHCLRREFIGDIVKASAAGIILPPFLHGETQPKTYTVSQIIEIILKELPGGRNPETVDTIKSGSGDNPVTGIVTTMFATIPVIHEAIKRKANFIIAHEPTFYNHVDNKELVPGNQVVKQKLALLDEHGITVWRFHDYWHRMHPDGIVHGVLLKTGWQQYAQDKVNFEIPKQSLREIVGHLKKTLSIPHLRVVGDLDASCSRISLLPGAWGGQAQMQAAETYHSDLLIVGEASEWETPEYVKDARDLGRNLSLIVLGHSFSEEPGMEYLVQWLQPKIPGVTIDHVASGEVFTWI
ncbi:MAG TPA: Nif3-like dinuclear metal center hexameric protein [Puia sp.]|nr:Nif3-like dinuclear metal center hexameric protein [Puia sp.]